MNRTHGVKFSLNSFVEILAVILGISTLGLCERCVLSDTCQHIVLIDGHFTGRIHAPNETCPNRTDVVCVLSFDTTVSSDNISYTTPALNTITQSSTTALNSECKSNPSKDICKKDKFEKLSDDQKKFLTKHPDRLQWLSEHHFDPALLTQFMSQKDTYNCTYDDIGLWLSKENDTYQLLLTREQNRPTGTIFFLRGKCNYTDWITGNLKCDKNQSVSERNGCNITCLNPDSFCDEAKYENCVASTSNDDTIKIKRNSAFCLKCGTPEKKPEVVIDLKNVTVPAMSDPSTNKAEAMKSITNVVLEMMGNKSTASVSLGEVQGVFVKPKERTKLETVSFVYSASTNLSIIQDKTQIATYPISLLVPKEAFEKIANRSNTTLFTSVFRFPNFTKDEKNSTVLNNEVYSIDMGAEIANLTNKVGIAFKNVAVNQATPSCQSWNGEGLKPNWTTLGCKTKTNGTNITCECEHLTFFAVLMVPNPENISSTDLSNLTYITSIGCGVSIFFLGVALFMHFLLRRARQSDTVHLLINLFVALVLLNLTFLTNEYVANTGHVIGCKLMAGFMHYCLLASFTWFSLEALHLCLQLGRSSSTIQHYITKICIAGWVPPAIVVAALFCMQKYSLLAIHTDTGKQVNMCWITDASIHYVVNIGYYSVVFAFTFTTFVVMLRWIFLLKGTKAGHNKLAASSNKRTKTGTSDVLTVMGLCCTLGLTWGFAFFAYGPLRLPSYYIFTIFNSFQGFFLFIYYYKTSQFVGDKATLSENTSSATEATSIDNPYDKPEF